MPPVKIKINSKFRGNKEIGYVRVESTIFDPEYARNLRAEVRDGLWMLCRQWQMGEFIGEDAGSPFVVSVTAARRNAMPAEYTGQPLEPFVEAEHYPDDLYTRIQAGQYLQSLLSDTAEKKFLESFKLAGLPSAKLETIKTQPEAYSLFQALKNKQIDGLQVYEKMGGTWIENTFNPTGESSSIKEIIGRFRAWFEKKYPRNDHWKTRSLDYTFELKGDTANAPAIKAEAYAGGKLDWDDVQLSNLASLNTPTHYNEFIPTPFTFKGMPAARWWEMEDSSVNLRRVDVSKTGILDTLFLEFALQYSNDWFLIPYTMDIGEVCTLHAIKVKDIFGVTTVIQQGSTGAGNNRFSLFEQAIEGGAPPSLLLFPAVSNMLESKPIEQVHFMRDEMANMVWAVESILPSQLGTGLPGGRLAKATEEGTPSGDGLPRYQLASSVPEHWIPFIPVGIPGKIGGMLFQRARMPYGSRYKGQILGKNTTPLKDGTNELPGYFIHEEEVSRMGAAVSRSYQRTRGSSGEIHVWIGRKNGVGRGEGSSGLTFDSLKPTNDDRLKLGHILMPGQSLQTGTDITNRISSNKVFTLEINNGRLVYSEKRVNRKEFPNAPWANAAQNKQVARLTMQENGILEVTDKDGKILWAHTQTTGMPGSMLFVHGDGYLVITDANFLPIWWWSPFLSNIFDTATFDLTGIFG
jgi:hypothetical protein